MEIDDTHFGLVAELLADGEVVPFLGAGANLCDRPVEARWEPGSFAPSGRELARALAEKSKYPNPDDPALDLLKVSQYYEAVSGAAPLYGKLREVFDTDYTLSSLHRLLARVPALLRERGKEQLLVLTTNYDDLVERALGEAREPFDVVWYAATGEFKGSFMHRSPDCKVVPIKVANKYAGLAFDERPVILKLHGAVDRGDKKRDSYVLTENSYIDYLAGPPVSKQIPAALMAKMEASHFLFLGYSMHDWNMRVILQQLWGGKELDYVSWAIQLEQSDEAARAIEKKLWIQRGNVELLYAPLKEYVERLGVELDAAPTP